jgi:hypothetical protein
LATAKTNSINFIMPEGRTIHRCRGKFSAASHSIHPMSNGRIGFADAGNNRIYRMSADGTSKKALNPLIGYPRVFDAIHLNDFVETPIGILASCFDYRPWRIVKGRFPEAWAVGGFGLILNITKYGRVEYSGLDHPHSLKCEGNSLYVCSSSIGVFHQFDLDYSLVEKKKWEITDDHFLRGACHIGDTWYLGGSRNRHRGGKSRRGAIYTLKGDTVVRRDLTSLVDIYDILPWDDSIMSRITHNFN